MRSIITPAVLFAAMVGLGCSASSDTDIDCAELASHEASLLVEMLPEDMRGRAARDMDDQRRAIESRCDDAPPSEAVARCQLAAADIRTHRLCTREE